MSVNTQFALKLLQTLYKCLITHPDSVSKIIRDSLSSIKISILSQSLSNLFAVVDDVFAQDEKKGSLIVEKVFLFSYLKTITINFKKLIKKNFYSNNF